MEVEVSLIELYLVGFYSFRVHAKNKWGFGDYSETVLVDASFKPEALSSPPVTINSGALIEISWTLPFNNGATIQEFEVMIQQKDGAFSANLVYCDGADATILVERVCEIPLDLDRLE